MSSATVQTKKGETFKQELEKLYRDNYQLVYRAAYNVTGNREDAQDVLQTIFVRLIRGQPPKDFLKNPKGYLYRAAVNEAISTLRSRERLNLTEDDVDAMGIQAPADSSFDDDMRRRLKIAISKLEPDVAALLIIRYVQGCSCDEIARMFGRTRAAVAMSLLRARRLLKKRMRTAGESR